MSESHADTAFTAALTQELAKKTAVCWLRYDGADHAVWHVWLDGSLCLVCGGDEQPLPEIEYADRVEVLMRSNDNGGRLLTWVGQVSIVTPEDEPWEPVTSALVKARLNLDDLATAADEWAETSLVVVVTPVGETTESPGSLPDDAHRAQPLTTPATTRGPLPRVFHRRSKRRPRLS